MGVFLVTFFNGRPNTRPPSGCNGGRTISPRYGPIGISDSEEEAPPVIDDAMLHAPEGALGVLPCFFGLPLPLREVSDSV